MKTRTSLHAAAAIEANHLATSPRWQGWQYNMIGEEAPLAHGRAPRESGSLFARGGKTGVKAKGDDRAGRLGSDPSLTSPDAAVDPSAFRSEPRASTLPLPDPTLPLLPPFPASSPSLLSRSLPPLPPQAIHVVIPWPQHSTCLCCPPAPSDPNRRVRA